MEATTLAPPVAAAQETPADVIAPLFAAQQAYQPQMRQTTAADRIDRLKRLRQALVARRADAEAALAADFGKPEAEVTLTEIVPVLSEIQHTIRHVKSWMRPKKVGMPLALFGTKAWVQYEPKGTALIIAPWNYPLALTLGPLVSAIAAGCTAILKPSEFTPHTTAFLRDLLTEVFDPREVTVVEGAVETSQALLKLPFDHLFFTGSPAVGKIVMRAAAEHLTSVTLELGGKSPTIVDETYDVEAAAKKIAWGKFSNAGQTCIAPDYVFVHASRREALVDALRQQLAQLYAQDADYANLVNGKHFDRVLSLLDTATDADAAILAGGTTDQAHHRLAPTLLGDVPLDAPVMQEEIFGPLLPILTYQSLEQVCAFINEKPKPLALYLFSNDEAHIDYVLHHTSAGGTVINDTLLHIMHPDLPFGGIGHSGIGRAHGHYGFLAFSNERAVLRQNWKFPLLQRLYPPYTARTQQYIDWLLKYFGAT